MPRLLLIRHGAHDLLGREIAGRRPGVHLNEAGRKEAEALARRLAPVQIAEIYSSPRERCLETAEPIARTLGQRVQIEAALDEVNFGHWTGRTLQSLEGEPLWTRFNRDRALTRIPSGETMTEVAARMTRFLDALTARHASGDAAVALVGHGDPLRAAIAHAIGLPLDFMLRFDIGTAALSILRTSEHGVLLECLNDRSHCA